MICHVQASLKAGNIMVVECCTGCLHPQCVYQYVRQYACRAAAQAGALAPVTMPQTAHASAGT